ncbi:MAG: DNA gyrase subunit A, partial [uncultured bacterium]
LFPKQKRAGVGVKVAKLTERTGNLVCAAIVSPEYKQVILTTKKAQVIKLPLKNIKQLGRATQGVILMRFGKQNDQVAAMTCLEDLAEEE